MPSRSVVRIDSAASGSGPIVPTQSAGNEYCSPSSHLSTAAVAQDDSAAAAETSSSDSKKSASTDAASETSMAMTEGRSHPEGNNCPNVDADAKVVSTSMTAAQSSISKTLRREDFNSALDYLEAKYVKSIVSEDDANTGNCSEQAAVKSSNDQMEDKSREALPKKRTNRQNTESDNKAKDLCKESKSGSDDGSGDKMVEGEGNSEEANNFESLVKRPNGKSATCDVLDTAIATADAASNEESSSSDPKNVDGSAFPTFEHLPHLPQPPQGHNKNPSNGPIRHQFAHGFGHWPKSSFPPHPFGMMYPPYPYPSPYFGMPPFVPQAPLPSPPNQGKNTTNQPPDTEKNKGKKKATPWYDAVDSVAKSSSSEANSTVIPSFSAFPYPSYLGMPPVVPQAPLPSSPKQGKSKNNTTQPDAEKNKVEKTAKSKVADDAVDSSVAKSSSSEANSPVIPALPVLPSIDMKALHQDSLVEEAKRLVRQEILAEKAGKKKVVQAPFRAVLPPPCAFPPLPPVQDLRQWPALPSAPAVDQASLSSLKKLKAKSSAVTVKEVPVEAIHLPKLPQLPPVEDATHLPVLPSASAVDLSVSSSHSDSASVPSRVEAILRKAGKADEKKAQVEALPLPSAQGPALPSASADSAPVSNRIEALLRKAKKMGEEKAQVETLPLPPAQGPALPSTSADSAPVPSRIETILRKAKKIGEEKAQVEALPLPSAQGPALPSASVDSAPVPSKIEAILRKAKKMGEEKAQVETLPLPPAQGPALPSTSAAAAAVDKDESPPSPSKKIRLDSSQIRRML